jgi:hypothetical protein
MWCTPVGSQDELDAVKGESVLVDYIEGLFQIL